MPGKEKRKTFEIGFQGKHFELAVRHRETDDELILFLHGLGCTKESFDEAFAAAQLRNSHLLALDFVGYGDSSKPRVFSYTMEDQAHIIHLMLTRIDARKIHIVAHSMGGAIGLLLAENIPGEIASFINIEGNLIAEDCGLVSRKTASMSFEEFSDRVFDKLRAKGPRPWREQSVKSDSLAFYRSSVSLVEWSDGEKLLEIFEKLNTPKVYVYGDRNADMKIISRLEETRKISISNSGHFLMNDNPAEFYALVHEVVTGRTP
jgi:pimeloyl-ACP methyl ester carboxylesterase